MASIHGDVEIGSVGGEAALVARKRLGTGRWKIRRDVSRAERGRRPGDTSGRTCRRIFGKSAADGRVESRCARWLDRG